MNSGLKQKRGFLLSRVRIHLVFFCFCFCIGFKLNLQAQNQKIEAIQPSCLLNPIEAVISEIREDGSFILDPIGVVILRDIRFPPKQKKEYLLSLSTILEGSFVYVHLPSRKSRWGEIHAVITFETGESLSSFLVKEGKAFVDNGEFHNLCEKKLLKDESNARKQKKGLWKDPQSYLLKAWDYKNLLQRQGQFMLVEGKIHKVNRHKGSIYLNFGRSWKHNVTLILSLHDFKKEPSKINQLFQLEGKRIRVRGIIDSWYGPTLHLYSLDVLEVLE